METLMSRGPGRIESAIASSVGAEPDNAFTVEDLCNRVYAGVNRIEKKHRVAVARAIRTLVTKRPDLATLVASSRGNTVVLYSRFNVLSYATARLKADGFNAYRPTANTAWGWRKDIAKLPPEEQERRLRAQLEPGGTEHRLVLEGGAWWRDTQLEVANRDGDAKRSAMLSSEKEAAFQEIVAAWSSR